MRQASSATGLIGIDTVTDSGVDPIDSEFLKCDRPVFRVSFHTLGCRLNQSESAALEGGFAAEGFEIVEEIAPSDLCIINTCFVTGQAEAKCRHLIRKLLRQNPRVFVAVTGCYAQAGMEALRQIAGIDLIAGTDQKMALPGLVRTVLEDKGAFEEGAIQKSETPVVYHSPRIGHADFEIPNLSVLEEATRSNVKIQDGCDFFCSFCIIPTTRGRSRSRRFDDVIREALNWATRGHLEIVLTGVNLGEYQHEGRDLADLIEALDEIDGLERIRISSIEPTTVSERMIHLMADSNKLCPYLHLPLQSGSDRVLDAMGRRYTREDYRSFVMDVMENIPNLGLGTDVMVGFPGETEADFEETVSLIETLPFTYLHVFPYSRREGTRVTRSNLSSVDPTVIKARAAALCALSDQKRKTFYRKAIGATASVLFETRLADGRFSGLTENYIRVAAVSDRDLRGRIAPVRIASLADKFAAGKLAG
ncbi:MAG: tRNA (N(6)-L-threonylcarbamoyladenosine(37)-C(2))-methylthiotransferase MtaB [Nitrospiria bacterium]